MKKYIELEIGGETYKLQYGMKFVAAAEKELSTHNILAVLSDAKFKRIPPSLSDLYILFKYALAGGDPEIKNGGLTPERLAEWEAEAENLYITAINERSIPEVLGICLITMVRGGVLGVETSLNKIKLFENVIENIKKVADETDNKREK